MRPLHGRVWHTGGYWGVCSRILGVVRLWEKLLLPTRREPESSVATSHFWLTFYGTEANTTNESLRWDPCRCQLLFSCFTVRRLWPLTSDLWPPLA